MRVSFAIALTLATVATFASAAPSTMPLDYSMAEQHHLQRRGGLGEAFSGIFKGVTNKVGSIFAKKPPVQALTKSAETAAAPVAATVAKTSTNKKVLGALGVVGLGAGGIALGNKFFPPTAKPAPAGAVSPVPIDPDTGLPLAQIDPNTGLPMTQAVDPATGFAVNTAPTAQTVDPATGLPLGTAGTSQAGFSAAVPGTVQTIDPNTGLPIQQTTQSLTTDQTGQQFTGQQTQQFTGQQTTGQQFTGQQTQQFTGQQTTGQQFTGQQTQQFTGQQTAGQQLPGQPQFPTGALAAPAA